MPRRLRDLSRDRGRHRPGHARPESARQARQAKPAACRWCAARPRLGPPLTGATKFVAIGLNYSDHAAEIRHAVPNEPIVFMKTLSCIQGPDDDIMLPQSSVKTDWEVELGIVIGTTRPLRLASATRSSHVAGYVLVNDVSEREYQLERGGTWDKGKGCDTFGPVGPWLVTTDEVPKPQPLDMWLDVNGEKKQRGNTRTMIFDCATLVSYVSQFMTLDPGRHHHHRHAARRRHGHEAAAVPEGRRHDDARHRGARRTAPEGRQVSAAVTCGSPSVCV